MRTTVRIEEDLMLELKEKASRERASLTRVLNQTLRAGLRKERKSKNSDRSHQEETCSMGVPRVDLSKALALAGQLEDEEALRKQQLRK